MQGDLQEEVIRCPNCKEEVPKTLYCLNCGHPLYKEEDKEEEIQEELETLIDENEEKTVENLVEKEVLVEEAPEPSPSEESIVSPPEEAEMEEPNVVEETYPDIAEAEAPTALEPSAEIEQAESEVPVEAAPPQEPEVIEEEPTPIEAEVTPCAEKPEECIEEKAPEPETLAQETQCDEVIEEVKEEPVVVVEPVEEKVVEPSKKFEPDPLVHEVMESLAKNISRKVKLVKLLQDGALKESTFNKLFEGYSAQGERWMSRRNEILERDRYDMENMEKSLNDAKVCLEELEIRGAIGDASEEEFAAKSPAYKWDIESLGEKLEKRRSEIAYLEDINQVMDAGETQGLKTIAESCYKDLNTLVESQSSSPETASRVKAALEDALELLKGSV